jgi:hypothetical protein
LRWINSTRSSLVDKRATQVAPRGMRCGLPPTHHRRNVGIKRNCVNK